MTRYGLILGAGLWLIGCSSGSSTNTDGGLDASIDAKKNDAAGPTGAVTGEPCTQDSDCATVGTGTAIKARCLKTVTVGGNNPDWVFTDGYCSMTGCKTSSNSTTANMFPKTQQDKGSFPNGSNTTCPGPNDDPDDGANNGFCTLLPGNENTLSRCLERCQTSNQCAERRGDSNYLCFFYDNNFDTGVCLPKALSQCNPFSIGSCPSIATDAGVPDGGSAGGIQSCVYQGPDARAGACVPGCDPFAGGGGGCALETSACHVQELNGEGLCFTGPKLDGGVPKAGSACTSDANCPGGYGCSIADGATSGKCYKYCKTSNAATQCKVTVPGPAPGDGGTDDAFTTRTGTCNQNRFKTATSVIGICSESD